MNERLNIEAEISRETEDAMLGFRVRPRRSRYCERAQQNSFLTEVGLTIEYDLCGLADE